MLLIKQSLVSVTYYKKIKLAENEEVQKIAAGIRFLQ